MEIYFPRNCVNQTELEKFDNAGAGKYTIGLGQTNMAFFGEREDINSICLTVVQSLFEKYKISPASIGRLEVGTETLLDKSKSVKTQLMQLFAEVGNHNVEGADTMNACYGGTNALFNAVQWVDSRHWDGRYALVVAADIAVYAAGNARPTGGGGAVALLIGRAAPLAIEPGLRGSHFEHVYDFYKPSLASEYPVVDGHLSVACYYKALDNCYRLYKRAVAQKEGTPFGFHKIDYMVFHSPFVKLVQKAFARLLYNDFLENPDAPEFADVQQFRSLSVERSYTDKELEAVFQKKTKDAYDRKVYPGTLLARELGNLYCGSVYGGVASLITEVGEALLHKRVLLFSYGSGMAASMFSLRVTAPLLAFVERLNLRQRLAQRVTVHPAEFNRTLKLREEHYGQPKWKPTEKVDDLLPGTFYLAEVDEKFRRFYQRAPPKSGSAL